MQPPRFEEKLTLSGHVITIRTMQPDDREIERAFVNNLSDRSRYLRFHCAVREISDSLLHHFVNVNYPQEMALIATTEQDGRTREIGVARYACLPGKSDEAEIAIVVSDDWQEQGLGTQLLLRLRQLALAAGMRELEAVVLPDNHAMLKLARDLGFHVKPQRVDEHCILLGKPVAD